MTKSIVKKNKKITILSMKKLNPHTNLKQVNQIKEFLESEFAKVQILSKLGLQFHQVRLKIYILI